MNAPYINTSFLRGFSALVLSKGGNPAKLYESVGLDKELFLEEQIQSGNEQSLLIPFDKFVYLLEETAKQLNFPDIAMQLAKQQDMMILAPLGPMLNQCQTVAEALDTLIKYLKILVSGYQIDVTLETSHMTIAFHVDLPHIQPLVQFQDYAMAVAVNVLYNMLGKNYPIRGCFFLRSEHNPERIKEYANYFGCPVAFNSRRLCLTGDKSVLKQDIRKIVKTINTRVNHALTHNPQALIEQVRQIISFSLANGQVAIEDIASAMHMSQRTLQRKLKQEGTSFSALLDSVRFNMANQYLKNTYYRVTDIALLLGYSNLSAFSRSYYRWCGMYPNDARKKLHQDANSDAI